MGESPCNLTTDSTDLLESSFSGYIGFVVCLLTSLPALEANAFC